MRLLTASTAVATIALIFAGAAAAKGCKSVSGAFNAARVDCAALFCNEAVMTGDLEATALFTRTSLTALPGGVFEFGGFGVLTAVHGGAQLYSTDSGYVTTDADGLVHTTTTLILGGGTKKYAGATGAILAVGTGTTATGFVGTYVGEVCKHGT